MFIPANGRFTTRTRLWRFFGRLAGVLCKPPFADFVKKSRIRCKRSLQDFYQRREQQCRRPAAFKNATVRERPTPACGDFLAHWPVYFISRRSLNSSRKTEFGASGHCKISTSDASKIAADRPQFCSRRW